MSWNYSFEKQEVVFIILFVLFYLFYILKTAKSAKKLNTTFNTIFIKILIRSIYFSLILVALLGPSIGKSKKEVKSVGKDIYIAVDLSRSMNAFDVPPTRLQKIKKELKKVVDAFSSDRIGLIIFSGDAFLQCPLTLDNNALMLFIETLNTELAPNTGTDFAPPLKLALEKLNSEESLVSQQKSKVILLISDGEDFGTETEEIAKRIKDSGIKLFTLGIGTAKGSLIPTPTGFKKDNNGNEVISRLNPESLKSLAIQTNGKYFEINDSQNDINRLINTISSIEGEFRAARTMDVESNKYYYFLSLALIFIILDVLINIKVIRL
jgi:Ca-activated chloride channel homolog